MIKGDARTLLLAALALLALAWLGSGTAHGAFPGENGKIAFERDGRIWVMNADGSAPRALTCRGGVVPAWSPDGRRIAFERDTGTDIGSNIWTIRSDGSGEALLALGGAPAWSPDGRRIAFNTPLTRLGWTQLGAMNADGSGWTLFPANGGMGSSSSPAWSPDGERIAFVSGHEIWVMNTDGADKAPLQDTWPASAPTWSPDGERIAFARVTQDIETPPNIFDIWVMSADGGDQVRLTTPGSGPAWSPDGERIAFARNGDIWVMNADGTEQTALTDGPARDRDPDWQRRPPPPVDPPLRQFCFEGLRRNTNRGIARLVVEVPRPGRVVLHRQPGVKRFAQAHRTAGPGRVVLRVRPRGWAQRLLARAGRNLHRVQLPVRAQVTYRPWVGEPLTKGRRVWLVRVGNR